MMRRALAFGVIPLALLLQMTDAGASAQRTFVASYGSPTNASFNCSLSKPCRAFSEAIGVTNPKGEVVVLDSAGYGPVTITQSVSIIASAGIFAGVTVSSGDGITINAGAADVVVLRGLSINGQGGLRGILFQAGGRLRIENSIVSAMSSAGIVNYAANGEMIVLDTIVRDNSGTGIYVEGDIVQTVLERVRSEHNLGAGLYVAPTPGSTGALATVIDSSFTHNAGKGVWASAVSGATTTIVVERSVMSSNGEDGFAFTVNSGANGTASLARNVLNDNGGKGIWMQSTDTNIHSAASENTVHRNSGGGIFADGRHAVFISSNSVIGPGTTVSLNCNDFNGGILSMGNNAADSRIANVCYRTFSGM